MIKVCVTLFTFLIAFYLSDSYAETYTWTDEQGTVHFTEDLEKVPKKIRNKARILENIEPAQIEKPVVSAPSATDPDVTLQTAPSNEDGKYSPAEIYAGKTFNQWEKDLNDREAAMKAVRKHIVEIVNLLSSPTTKGAEQEKLLAEHTSLLEQFNGMKTQYNQQVEIARKAGININILK
jgi:Domain of unknown function (DUF4124)